MTGVEYWKSLFDSYEANLVYSSIESEPEFKPFNFFGIPGERIPVFGDRFLQIKANFTEGDKIDKIIADCRVVAYVNYGTFKLHDNRVKKGGSKFIFNGKVPTSIEAIDPGEIYFQLIKYSK